MNKRILFTFGFLAIPLGLVYIITNIERVDNTEDIQVEYPKKKIDESKSMKSMTKKDLSEDLITPDADEASDIMAPVSLKDDSSVRDEILKHVVFKPRFVNDGFIGYEIISDSTEFSLEDFGLLSGDILIGFGIDTPVKQDTFEEVLLSHVKYGSVITKINRNNFEHHVELDLDSLIFEDR